MDSELMAVVVGVTAGAVFSVLTTILAERRGRSEWRRQARLDAAGLVLDAFQRFSREIVTLAISDVDEIDGTTGEWVPFHEAAHRWNAARLRAELLAPPEEVALIHQLDQSLDEMLDKAITKRWHASDFRQERSPIGSTLARYVDLVRASASEGRYLRTSSHPWSDEESARHDP